MNVRESVPRKRDIETDNPPAETKHARTEDLGWCGTTEVRVLFAALDQLVLILRRIAETNLEEAARFFCLPNFVETRMVCFSTTQDMISHVWASYVLALEKDFKRDPKFIHLVHVTDKMEYPLFASVCREHEHSVRRLPTLMKLTTSGGQFKQFVEDDKVFLDPSGFVVWQFLKTLDATSRFFRPELHETFLESLDFHPSKDTTILGFIPNSGEDGAQAIVDAGAFPLVLQSSSGRKFMFVAAVFRERDGDAVGVITRGHDGTLEWSSPHRPCVTRNPVVLNCPELQRYTPVIFLFLESTF